MDRRAIEKEVRRRQYEVWSKREWLWPLSPPVRIERMFDPPMVARVLGSSTRFGTGSTRLTRGTERGRRPEHLTASES